MARRRWGWEPVPLKAWGSPFGFFCCRWVWASGPWILREVQMQPIQTPGGTRGSRGLWQSRVPDPIPRVQHRTQQNCPVPTAPFGLRADPARRRADTFGGRAPLPAVTAPACLCSIGGSPWADTGLALARVRRPVPTGVRPQYSDEEDEEKEHSGNYVSSPLGGPGRSRVGSSREQRHSS